MCGVIEVRAFDLKKKYNSDSKVNTSLRQHFHVHLECLVLLSFSVIGDWSNQEGGGEVHRQSFQRMNTLVCSNKGYVGRE